MRLFTLLIILISAFSLADNKRKYTTYATEDKEWAESEQALPPFPDLESDDWQSFYVSETYNNTPMILLDSIVIAPDNSARYILNVRGAKGSNNVSVEGIRCTNRLNKTFAFGDTSSNRWIMVQNSDWKSIRPQDSMRQRLREIFCFNTMPRNQEEAITRIKAEAGKISPNKKIKQ